MIFMGKSLYQMDYLDINMDGLTNVPSYGPWILVQPFITLKFLLG